jgi:hypothetical protein
VFESNGPDVKVRGNAQHVAEKYLQLARDAQSSGDSVMAENYFQHAEHYLRILAATQPVNPQGQQGVRRPFGADEGDDEDGLDGDDEESFVAGQGPQPDVMAGEGRDQQQPRGEHQQREHRDQRPPREGGEGRDYRGDDQRREPRGDFRGNREGYRPREGGEREYRSRDRDDQRPQRDDRPPRDDRPQRDDRPRDEYRARDDRDQRPPRPEPRAERSEPRPVSAEEGNAPAAGGEESNGWAAPDFLRRPAAGGGSGRPRREPRPPRPDRRPLAEGAGDAPEPVEAAPDETSPG